MVKKQALFNQISLKGCLSHLAANPKNARRRFSNETLSKNHPKEHRNCNPFVHDFKILLESNAIRRLTGKTQVFPLPSNIHMRNRLTHTLEIVAHSITAADILGLNKELSQAIALGHDIGHSPFGHAGEKILSTLSGKNFHHAVFSCILAQFIECGGNGLNLTHDCLLGMRFHSRGSGIVTQSNISAEADLVMYLDKIGYIFSDLEDVLKQSSNISNLNGILKQASWFGETRNERITHCIDMLCLESSTLNKISFSESVTAQKFKELKQSAYDGVYKQLDKRDILAQQKITKVYKMIEEHFIDIDPLILIALMTDKEVMILSSFKGRNVAKKMMSLSIGELFPVAKKNSINIANPSINW